MSSGIEKDGLAVEEVSDNEDEGEASLEPPASKFAGELSEALLAEVNAAIEALFDLGMGRPEEKFATKLLADMQDVKKWTQKMHFQVPRQQISIKSFFNKEAIPTTQPVIVVLTQRDQNDAISIE